MKVAVLCFLLFLSLTCPQELRQEPNPPFSGLRKVHGIHSIICPISDSETVLVIHSESFRNLHKHEFFLMEQKCLENGVLIEIGNELGALSPVLRDGQKKYLRIMFFERPVERAFLKLEYSNSWTDSIRVDERYQATKRNDVFDVGSKIRAEKKRSRG